MDDVRTEQQRGAGREAGRELDAKIALALGWVADPLFTDDDSPHMLTPPDDPSVVRACPHYSSDIAAAFQVVEAMQRRFPGMRFSLLGGDEQWGYTDTGVTDYDGQAVYAVDKSRRFVFGWRARFFGEQDPTKHTPFSWGDEHADTIPLAICLAALAALDASTPLSGEDSNG